MCSRGKQVCSRHVYLSAWTKLDLVQLHHRLTVLVTGTVQVAEIQAGWQKPLDVKGLTWTEPQELGGRQLASVEHIRTSQALLDVVKGMTCTQSLALDLLGVLAAKHRASWHRTMSCHCKHPCN